MYRGCFQKSTSLLETLLLDYRKMGELSGEYCCECVVNSEAVKMCVKVLEGPGGLMGILG